MLEDAGNLLPVVLAVLTALPSAWLTVGVRDNILHPNLNEAFTAEVVSMARMQRDYPESYALVGHRAITARRTQVFLFRLIVGSEIVVVAALWVGVLALLLAAAGAVSVQAATTCATFAMLGFVTIWGVMLIGGNHFCYWFCHEGTQVTHFFLVLWGVGNLLALLLA